MEWPKLSAQWKDSCFHDSSVVEAGRAQSARSGLRGLRDLGMATTPPGSPLGLFHCTVLIRVTHTLMVWLEGEYHPANAPQREPCCRDSPHPAPMSQPGISCPQSRVSPIEEVKISLSLGWARALFLKVFLLSLPSPKKHFSPSHPHQPYF